MSDSDTKLMFRSVLSEPIAPKGTFDLYVLSDSGAINCIHTRGYSHTNCPTHIPVGLQRLEPRGFKP